MQSKRKLLQINSVVNYGSTGRIVEELGQVAIANGWESYIACARNISPSKSNLIKIGDNWDIKFHGLQTRLFDRHGLGSKNATLELIKQIDKIQPDIIHLHNLHGYYLNIKVLFEYLAKVNIPIIWTFHDCWPLTGHCSHFEYVGCEKWKSGCYSCPLKREYPASIGLDRSKKNYELKKQLFNSIKRLTIVPVSEWLGKIVKLSYLAKYPIQVINNGINTEVFKPLQNASIRNKYGLNDQFLLLGVASIWSPRKGLKDFNELSKRINDNTKIILVGLTNKQISTLPNNIIGISRTENIIELAELYSASDIYINPTWEDNFPTTNLESLACGTPVITYDTGGSPEAIDADTGFVVEKGNITGLKEAIEIIQKNGKKYYTESCRKRALNLYNKDDRFGDYISLFFKHLPLIKTKIS